MDGIAILGDVPIVLEVIICTLGRALKHLGAAVMGLC